MENLLEVRNLTVKFNGEKAIDNLSFDLKEKENLMIVGPNGAGKTVLLKVLLGIIPYEGQINWKKSVKIGYVPQKFFPAKEIPLSVEEFFKFKKALSVETKKWLKAVGVDESILKKQIGTLSAGQFQRIMIAWALIDEPDILFFDEPTSGIDIGGEETIYNLLENIEKQTDLAIIMVTHDLNVVYKLANNVLCLNKKKVCYGAPTEILKAEKLEDLYGKGVSIYKHEHHH